MALQFPTNPADGYQVTLNGKVWRYNATTQLWTVPTISQTQSVALARTEITATAGQTVIPVVYNTSYGVDVSINGLQLLSTDFTATNGTSITMTEALAAGDQVVIMAATGGAAPVDTSGGGATTYALFTDLPSTGNTNGDQAFVTETGKLYLWTYNTWFAVALVTANPTITQGSDASYKLATDGTPTVITLTATDPEGMPITWSYTISSGTLGSIATISQADNVFTITPSTNSADAGNFEITFVASDGVGGVATSVSGISLAFGLTLVAEGQYVYPVDFPVNTFSEIETVLEEAGLHTTLPDTHFYVKYTMYDDPSDTSSTRTIIAKVHYDSGISKWAQSAFEYTHSETLPHFVSSSDTTATSSSGANIISIAIANDDNDNLAMRGDGNPIFSIAQSSGFATVSDFRTSNIASTASTSMSADSVSKISLHLPVSASPIGNVAHLCPFPAVGGEVWFDFSNQVYYVNATQQPFSSLPAAVTASSIWQSIVDAASTNGVNTSRISITDEIGQGFITRPADNAGGTASTGIFFEVDWQNGVLVNVEEIGCTLQRYYPTEEDSFGDQLQVVNCGITFLALADGGLTQAAHVLWGQDIGNWKRLNNIASGGGTYVGYAASAAAGLQPGMDYISAIDGDGNIWAGDWGHDDGGIFNVGTDTYLSFGRLNMRIIPTDLY